MHVSFIVESEKLYYIALSLDFKYGDHSLFTGVSVTNYAN